MRISAHLRRTLATHASPSPPPPPTRHSWTKHEIQTIYDAPLLDLVFRAASVHRQYHDPSKIQLCTLMNIKSESRPHVPASSSVALTHTLSFSTVTDHPTRGVRFSRRLL